MVPRLAFLRSKQLLEMSLPLRLMWRLKYHLSSKALSHGCHVASNLEAGPVDSGVTFQPDEYFFPSLLDGLPSLSQEDKDSLERPFTIAELEAPVEAVASNKSPSLNGLSYEFYRSTFHGLLIPLQSFSRLSSPLNL